jgi:hypothetical protein
MKHLIGTDIELVPSSFVDPKATVIDRARDIMRVHEVTGSKDSPVFLPNGASIHPDSAGVEFTTHPAPDADAFENEYQTSLMLAQDMLGMELVPIDTYDVSELTDALAAVSPFGHHVVRAIMEIGCDPDFIDGAIRHVPRAIKIAPVRELGGHLHIDTTQDAGVVANALAEALAPYHTGDESSWYRRPGVYRPKPYGLEYRSLGASWLASSETRNAVFNAAQEVA